MEREPTNRRLLLWLIVGALAVWGLFLGLGSFLGLDSETPDYDIRRMAMATGSVGVFLAIWMGLLWRRGKR